jgi:hypothetical protein
MKIILGIFLFFASIFSVIAQDKKGVSLFRPKNQDLVEQLSKQNDNLKRNLAEARREWQKARDAIQSIDSVYQEQLKNQEKAVLEGQESKEELNRSKIIWTDSIAVLHRIIDSLQRSSQVSTSQSLDEQSNAIKELLKIYPKSQYQIKVEKGNISVLLSDSLVFTSYYQLSISGRNILQKLISVFQNSKASYFGIHAYPDESTKPMYYHKIAQAKLQTLHYYALTYQLPYAKTILHAHPKSFPPYYQRTPIIIEFHYP